MLDSPNFWLGTTAIVVLISCYVLFMIKFRLKNESSDFPDLSDSLQEIKDELLPGASKDLPAKRRDELLEKIKEQRIREYLDEKKRRMT